MPTQLTTDDFKQSLNGHVAVKGEELRGKYGPVIGWDNLLRVLGDRACVRYPCEIAFDETALGPGEFAHPAARGERPEDGFVMHVHPCFQSRLDSVPALVLYQLVLVNYGEFASPDDAETFGAAALGLEKDEYYNLVCDLAAQVPAGNAPCETQSIGASSCHH
jgi:hypothetical protein